MQIHIAKVNDLEFKYSIARGALAQGSNYILPHPQGGIPIAVCRECGFAVAARFEADAVHHLIASLNVEGAGHTHERGHFAHMQFEPVLIDYIYDAFSLERMRA